MNATPLSASLTSLRGSRRDCRSAQCVSGGERPGRRRAGRRRPPSCLGRGGTRRRRTWSRGRWRGTCASCPRRTGAGRYRCEHGRSCLFECLAFGGGLLVPGQSGDVVAGQAAVQGAAGELGIWSLRHPSTSSSGRRVRRRNSTMMASSASVSLAPASPVLPPGDRCAILCGGGTGRRLRRLELGLNARRCWGAAVKNACYSGSCSTPSWVGVSEAVREAA